MHSFLLFAGYLVLLPDWFRGTWQVGRIHIQIFVRYKFKYLLLIVWIDKFKYLLKYGVIIQILILVWIDNSNIDFCLDR